jgi:hypothetical protein
MAGVLRREDEAVFDRRRPEVEVHDLIDRLNPSRSPSHDPAYAGRALLRAKNPIPKKCPRRARSAPPAFFAQSAEQAQPAKLSLAGVADVVAELVINQAGAIPIVVRRCERADDGAAEEAAS